MTQTPEQIEAPPLGTVLGNGYELRRFLGAGGVGAVYEALAPGGGRVALKVLLEAALRADREQVLKRFEREALITTQLDSPHIVPALEAGFDEALGVPFMVMPLLVGLDLEQQVEQNGPLHPAVAVRIARQACAALQVAHQAGVVHRDIKPANIFLDHHPQGAITVRLLDFGLAKWQEQDGVVTASDSLLGTPHFMAPEQIESAKLVDHRSDIYSLGASLYWALCGAAPFEEARTLGALLTSVLTKGAPPLQTRAPWVPPALAAVVHGTLLREEEARCPSAAELWAALEPCNDGTDELSVGVLQPLTPEQLGHRAEPAELPTQWQLLTEPEPASTQTFEITQAADDPLIGRSIAGRYRVLRSLGRGGMGTVYEALAAEGDRVALKVMRAEAATERRLLREAQAAKAISSPHVVRVYEVETDLELQLPFLVMELLTGADLAALIKQHGALPPRLAARLFVQACHGLGAAHAQGFVHRDIKPANLFVHRQPDGEGVLKICDFGVVKRLPGVGYDSVALTQSTGVIGSPAYMSPEQATRDRDIDWRTDVWSLGVTLFQALCGAHPWSEQAMMGGAISTAPAPHLRDRAPWIPLELAAVVHRAMAPEPESRFQSMAELAAALEPFTEGVWRVLYEDLRGLAQQVRSGLRPQAAGLAAGEDTTDLAIAIADSAADDRWGITRAMAQPGHTTGSRPAQSLAPQGSRRGAPGLAPQRSRLGAKLALAAVAVAGAAAFAFWLLREPTPAALPAAPEATEQQARAAGSAAISPEHRVAVAISPTVAEVTVDGARRGIGTDGKLWLSGKPDTSFVVVVVHGGHRLERKVVITTAGTASPSRLALSAPPAATASRAAAAGPPEPHVARPASSTAAPKPAAAPAVDKPYRGEVW